MSAGVVIPTPTPAQRLDALYAGNGVKLEFGHSESILDIIEDTHGKNTYKVPCTDILWAGFNDGKVELSYINRKKKRNGTSALVCSVYDVFDKSSAQAWCDSLMKTAYEGAKPSRRLKVLVNPKGGPGKAVSIYEKLVKPIFEAAHCSFDTTFTEREKHAADIAKNLDVSLFDALVLLSGDGLLHEIYNGFAARSDILKAFALPVAPVPTGSANGMVLNLLGIEDGFDVSLACLNAIKGKSMKLDICSVTIGDKRVFSYFSVALGLMADLDLGTEHLRRIGDLRFVIGYLQGVMKMKACPIELEMKGQESDKDLMVKLMREAVHPEKRKVHEEMLASHTHELDSQLLPALKHTAGTRDDEWIKFEKPILSFYSGSAPWVARDLMQFPLAQPSDGLIDIVVQEPTSRRRLLSFVGEAHAGASYWDDTQHYFKAQAYRITPQGTGNLAIDGERYDLQPFVVECHKALGTLLSPSGHYAAEFNVPKPVKPQQRDQADEHEHTSPLRRVFCCGTPV